MNSTDDPKRTRTRRLLLLSGGLLVVLGAVALVGAAVVGGRSETAQNPPTTSTSFTMDTAPGATFPGGIGSEESTRTVTPPPASPTTVPGETTVTPGTNEATSTPPGSGPATSGNDERLVALSRQIGFTVFALQDPAWRLDQLTSGETQSHGYVAMVYRRGAQYVSISQEPRDQPADLPSGEAVTVGGQSARLIDMGSVVLIGWNAQGTGITFSTDVDRATAVALAARVQPVR